MSADATAGGVGAAEAARWIRAFAAAIAERRDELTRLDQAIGDADHGINMHRGMQAVVAKLDEGEPEEIGALMRTVAMTLISKVGGASGPLYGTFFLQFGSAADGPAVTPQGWSACFDAAVAGVRARGKAEPGDKTMLDALIPAGDALRGALGDGAAFPEALARAADAAREGAEATIPMVARKGRASYLGERSAGHKDPGAASSALLVGCAARTWSGTATGSEE